MTTTQRTVRELIPALGEQVAVRFEKMIFDCTVLDAKNSYGQVRILVQPIKGSGEQWIELGRLTRYAANVAPAASAWDICSNCGESHVNHRQPSGNSAAFCVGPNSRPGDRFLRGAGPTSLREVR